MSLLYRSVPYLLSIPLKVAKTIIPIFTGVLQLRHRWWTDDGPCHPVCVLPIITHLAKTHIIVRKDSSKCTMTLFTVITMTVKDALPDFTALLWNNTVLKTTTRIQSRQCGAIWNATTYAVILLRSCHQMWNKWANGSWAREVCWILC